MAGNSSSSDDFQQQSREKADENKQAALAQLHEWATAGMQVYLTIDVNPGRVTWSGILSTQGDTYFVFTPTVEPGYGRPETRGFYGVDFDLQQYEATAPRAGTPLGTYVKIYRAQQTSIGPIPLQRTPFDPILTISTQALY